MTRPARTTILDARALSRALERMAVEILELAHGTDHLLFVGIQRRRVELGTSLSKLGQLTQSAVGRVVRGEVVVRRSAVRRRATTPPSARGRENTARALLQGKLRTRRRRDAGYIRQVYAVLVTSLGAV